MWPLGCGRRAWTQLSDFYYNSYYLKVLLVLILK